MNPWLLLIPVLIYLAIRQTRRLLKELEEAFDYQLPDTDDHE